MEMERVLTSTERLLPQADNGNACGNPQALEIGSLYQAAYEVGYARGHEAGFRTGYKEGLADGLKSATNASAAPRASEPDKVTITRAVPRLLGLPCEKCGAFYYSHEAQCPRCNTVKVTREAK